MAKKVTNESSGYAKELKLSDGRRVSFRLMEAADKQRVLKFAHRSRPTICCSCAPTSPSPR
jgi:hypothetical protein